MTVEVIVTTMYGSGGRDAGDRLLAAEVARVSELRPDEVKIARSCAHCGGHTHGRPIVTAPGAPFVSLSRAEGVVLVAVSPDCPVGIDVEEAEAGGFPGFADVAQHPDETASGPRDRSRLWVRKEAVLKATGDGLRLDPSRIRISDGAQDPRLLAWPEQPTPAVHLLDVELDGYIACVAVLGDRAPRLTLRQGDPAALAD